jgi:uncharacterized phiE125 gp8 family phage protein
MMYRVITPANTLPVTLPEARIHLRMTDPAYTQDDNLVINLIDGAARWFEGNTQKALMSQTWRVSWYAQDVRQWGNRVPVPGGYLRSVVAVRTIADDGTVTTLNPATYSAEQGQQVSYLHLREGVSAEMLQADVIMGYGVDPLDVPADIRQGILQMVATQYAMRQDQSFGEGLSAAKAMYSAETVFARYRSISFA